jgi:hypothetical protein
MTKLMILRKRRQFFRNKFEANKEKKAKKEEFLAGVARHRFDLPQDFRFSREELYGQVGTTR